MKHLPTEYKAGDGVRPLWTETHLLPREQRRVDLIVEVDKAILRHDTKRMMELMVKVAEIPILAKRLAEALK